MKEIINSHTIKQRLQRLIGRRSSAPLSFGVEKFDDTKLYGELGLVELTEPLISGRPFKTDHYTLILGTSGSCHVSMGRHSFTLRSDTISLLNENQIFTFNQATKDFKANCILFHPSFLEQAFVKTEIVKNLLNIDSRYAPIFELSKNQHKKFQEYFGQVNQEYQNEEAFHLDLIRLTIVKLLYEYNRVCENCLLSSKQSMSRQYQIVYKFKELIDENFLQFQSVQEYARELCISPKHLTDCVKRETGNTAISLIHKRMILEAEYLLENSGLSIKEIGSYLSFDTSSHFSRFFKKVKNKTPSQYRKEVSF